MNKKADIGILGGGESGVGAALLAKRKGLVPFVSDFGKLKQKYKEVLIKEGIEWEEGQHSLQRLSAAKMIVKSPGIADEVSIVQQLKKNAEIISEVEFAYRYCTAKIIAITGSNGKTTTANLTYHILKKAGLHVGLAGNVGRSIAKVVATEDYDYIVLELSSFQLDNIRDFRANINILLNITPDHLDRYGNSFENYVAAKMRLIENTTEEDFFIYCKDDRIIENELKTHSIKAKKIPFSLIEPSEEGAYIKNEDLIININHKQLHMSIHDLALQGKHNLYNSMASGIASRVLDLRKEVIRESLSDFKNIEHRLEHVATIHGIEFINDSKATNINSTWYALESMNQNVIWIVGGVDKGNDYDELRDLVKDKVKAVVCLGKNNQKIIDAFKEDVSTIIEAFSAEEAVRHAYSIGRQGDVVLLSPACASFDLFEDYEDRGQQFKKAVRAL